MSKVKNGLPKATAKPRRDRGKPRVPTTNGETLSPVLGDVRPTTNTDPAPPPNPPQRPSPGEEKTDMFKRGSRAEELIVNILSLRRDMLRRQMDPRRSIEDECGYPEGISSHDYQTAYDRWWAASRVVEVLPKETWQTSPSVYEDEDAEVTTPFEEAWDALNRRLRSEHSWYQDEKGGAVWEYLLRADILSGIGRYGVILIGLSDGQSLNSPVHSVAEFNSVPAVRNEKGKLVPKDEHWQSGLTGNGRYGLTTNSAPDAKSSLQVTYLRVFPESLADVVTWEYNRTSPRYGMPLEYSLQMGGDSSVDGGGTVAETLTVHWTRVIHVADTHHSAGPSEVLAVPRMQQVFNNLMNIHKIQGASPEGYWKSCFTGLGFNADDDTDFNLSQFRDMMEGYGNSQQKYFITKGMSVTPLAPSVVDPTPHVKGQIEAICIKLGIPVRIFMGSERGELASTQDDGAWNDRIRLRQNGYVTPRLIVPFVDRLIMLGCLPEPKGYSVCWDDLESATAGEKAGVAVSMTSAISSYVSSGAQTLMAPMDFLTRVLPFSEEEALTILDNATKQLEDETEEETEDGTTEEDETDDNGKRPVPEEKQLPDGGTEE